MENILNNQTNDYNTSIIETTVEKPSMGNYSNGKPRIWVPKPTGRPKGCRSSPNAKKASFLSKRFKKLGLDWQKDFAEAIKANKRERIKLWLRLLPYMLSNVNNRKAGKWNGKASTAAKLALDAMEQDIRE